MISNAGGYFDDERILSKATPYSVMKIDTAKVRNKRLNSYYDFDQNGFMINAVINKAKLPTEVVLKLIPKVINPSVYCYVEKPFLLTGGYASYVSFNGIEQKQCENISNQQCEISTDFGFSYSKVIPLMINQQLYQIKYECTYD